ncbi:MAG: hypothetical protein PUB75_01225 [Firmicutes bacterium]|nr:hypothetical protein [Bacillota bacterium]
MNFAWVLKNEKNGISCTDADVVLYNKENTSIPAGLVDSFAYEDPIPGTSKRGFGSGKRATGLPPLSLSLVEN